MTPARKVVKAAQALAVERGHEYLAEWFRRDEKGYWEKQARDMLFAGVPNVAEKLFERGAQAAIG